MSEDTFTQDLKDTIVDLGKNITLLKEAEQINLHDCQTLIATLFEVLKDILERFEPVFEMVEEIYEINKATEKGEKHMEEDLNQSVKRMYL